MFGACVEHGEGRAIDEQLPFSRVRDRQVGGHG